ncbi:internal core protein A [Vibrio phage vB_VpaP_G1]|uniref:Internal core protein A n=1 Tax=Vibrio phage vB_VpaP_G1 TaxID=2862773 RepID=A0AAE7WUX2_9CAUD|nr:internal virion protein [Vibrio phage vB_VpaP_G1]QYW05824.1 internal core protein A [Vibrio phage vB_VpaP_G1]
MPDLLQTPDSLQVNKPQPIQVQMPSSQRMASSALQADPVRYREATDNFVEAKQAVQNVQANNLKAMAALTPHVGAKIAQMQQDEYNEGFYRYMQGESVQKMAEEQPFKGFFGDGATVRGARAAQHSAMANSIDMWVSQNQGTLSRLSMDEQRRAIIEYGESLKTGDPTADRMLADSIVKRAPVIMDNLTRIATVEHLREGQIAQADVIKTEAESMNWAGQAVLRGELSQDSYRRVQEIALDKLQPLPNQTQESYRTAMQSAVSDNIRAGNFDMADLIEREILNPMLTPDERFAMEKQSRAARAEWLLNNPVSRNFMEFTTGVPSQISAGRYSSKEELSDALDSMNAEYSRETTSLTPLIDNEQRGKFLAMWDTFNQRQQAAVAKLSQDQLDAEVKRTIFVEAYAKGSVSGMNASGIGARERLAIEQNEAVRFFNEPDAGKSTQVIARLAAQGYTNPTIKENLNQPLSLLKGGATPSQASLVALQGAYNKLVQSPQGLGAASAYFEDDLRLMQQMQHLDLTDPKNVAYIKELAKSVEHKVTVPQDVQKRANDMVAEEIEPGWFSRYFGEGRPLGAGAVASIKSEMAQRAAETLAMYPNMSEEDALKVATQKVMKSKDMAGDYLLTNSTPGNFLKTLNSTLNVPIADTRDTRINSMLSDYVKSKVPHNQDYQIGGILMTGSGDRAIMELIRDDGTQVTTTLNLSELAEIENKKQVQKADRRKQLNKQAKQVAYGTLPIGSYGR